MVGVRFKHFFGTYLCRQSSLVLEVQPFLFVFIWQHFGPLLHFFQSFCAIFSALWGYFGSGSGSNTFLESTYKDNQLLFMKCSSIFLFFIWTNLVPFFAFFGPFGDNFGVGVRFKNFSGTCLHRLTAFILEV